MKKLFTAFRERNQQPSQGTGVGKIIWNIIVIIFSSAAVAFLSLALAFGTYDYQMFRDYFTKPLLLLLNWLPVLLLQLFVLALFGKQWVAYLVSAVFVLGCSAGDFYKLKLRNEPFVFTDISFIKTGLSVAENYDMAPGPRVIIAAAAIAVGTVLILLLARGKINIKLRAMLGAAVIAVSIPLWVCVYSSGSIYYSNATTTQSALPTREFCAKGFVYPFLYSAANSSAAKPKGYDEQRVKELLSGYADTDIPAEKRVNIIAVQLESFSDLRAGETDGIADFVYSTLDEIKAESFSGKLVANVRGGGTIETEHSVLTGEYFYHDVNGEYHSFVQYMKGQEYVTAGIHPYYKTIYNRLNRNSYLGFENYRFLEDGFEELTANLYPSFWYSDTVLFPEILKQYREITNGGSNAFLFNVTMQGHSPYNTEEHLFPEQCFNGEASAEIDCWLNNYLGSMMRTQASVREFLDELSLEESPVVVVMYGDHKPSFGSDYAIPEALGMNIDSGTREGMLNLMSTDYFIWANDAAKAVLGKEFSGEGPDISPFALFPTLFNYLGWEGSAENAYLTDITEKLPVISANGYYMEDGEFTHSLSEQGQQLVRELEYVQYYLRTHTN